MQRCNSLIHICQKHSVSLLFYTGEIWLRKCKCHKSALSDNPFLLQAVLNVGRKSRTGIEAAGSNLLERICTSMSVAVFIARFSAWVSNHWFPLI